jgi:hypothetical protein
MQLVLRKPVSRTAEACAISHSPAADFDKTFGPVLMVTYACLSNTLLLTGMSLLSDKLLLLMPKLSLQS